MNPQMIGILSSLMGGIGGLFGNDRMSAEKLEKLFGVGALNNDTQKLFDFMQSSKFGQFGKQNAALQGSLFGDELKRRGAAIGGSGVGMIASSAAGATQAFQEGDFLSKLFAQAQSGAQENLQGRLAAYSQGGNAPSGLGGIMGAIANAGGQYALLAGQNKGDDQLKADVTAFVDEDMARMGPPKIRKQNTYYNSANLSSLLGQ